jgi:hypothetical protein
MASRQWNGGMVLRAAAWSGLVLLAALDGALLRLPPARSGHHDRPDRMTRRSMARPSHQPAGRTARQAPQDGVVPISDRVLPR